MGSCDTIFFRHTNMNLCLVLLPLIAQIFASGSCNEVREKRNILTLLDLIDDFCDGEDRCINDVTDDLINYISNDPYDPQDRDAGASRMTVLLESLDDSCEGDEGCLEDLFEDLRKRVINNSNDYNGADDDYDELFNTHANEEDDFFDEDDNDDDFWDEDDEDDFEDDDDSYYEESTENPDSGWGDDDEFDSSFERFELNESLDETIVNEMNEDECLQNREACEKFVEKEEKLGLNHIGEIQYDQEGQPVAFVPKSMVFKEELRIPKGGDDPEGL